MMDTEVITIDRGIPMPRRWASMYKYPWLDMKPGDSFLWPMSVSTAREACVHRKRKYGESYHVAKVTEDGKHLIRVWRVG